MWEASLHKMNSAHVLGFNLCSRGILAEGKNDRGVSIYFLPKKCNRSLTGTRDCALEP